MNHETFKRNVQANQVKYCARTQEHIDAEIAEKERELAEMQIRIKSKQREIEELRSGTATEVREINLVKVSGVALGVMVLVYFLFYVSSTTFRVGLIFMVRALMGGMG